MITLRLAAERGQTALSWLESYHTFSFGEYVDPRHMGFRTLRVLNDDVISPGMGFGMHPHRDMEILTCVFDGALEHRDSLGTGSVIRPGDLQRMSAGRGILHSEFNASVREPVHLLQIWIVPEQRGLEPSYEQRTFDLADRQDRLQLVAARTGRDGAVTIHQDVDVYATTLSAGARVEHHLRPGRAAWVQVARGQVEVNGQALGPGDGAAVEQEDAVTLTGVAPAELLLFDLA